MNRSRNTSLVLAVVFGVVSWAVMNFVDVDPLLQALVLGAVAVVAWFYAGKKPRELPEKKPRFTWMPKYRCRCPLPESIRESDDPARALTLRLGDAGFTCDRQTPLALHFTRGHAKGDFSVDLIKINLTVSLPIEEEIKFLVEAGWLVAFDTGDIWQLTTELKSLLATDPSPQSPA